MSEEYLYFDVQEAEDCITLDVSSAAVSGIFDGMERAIQEALEKAAVTGKVVKVGKYVGNTFVGMSLGINVVSDYLSGEPVAQIVLSNGLATIASYVTIDLLGSTVVGAALELGGHHT